MKSDPKFDDALTLDPGDWTEFRAVAHAAIDDATDRIRTLRDGPVWQPMPEDVRAAFSGPVPSGPQSLREVYEQVATQVIPHAMGNVHPRFWAWYMGAGDLAGALADFLAGVDGSNLGVGDTAASLVDQQVTRWIREMMRFPEGASGALVSGGTMANIIGLTAARNAMAGIDLRKHGLAQMERPLAFYASDQVHSCHHKAMNLLGLGANALRHIPTDDGYRIDVRALRDAIAADRKSGIKPACVIATAGSTNTGSVDDLNAIADLCARERIWMHVDGCIGALIAIAPRNAHLVDGIERADSLALDLHKWLHAPFDVGCVLMRDRARHRSTFAENAEYLQPATRGLAAGEFLHDFTLETSRGFRALKVWMMLKHHGVEMFGRLIDQNIYQARYLTGLVEAEPSLELMAPTATSVVCFRFNPGGSTEDALRALNTELLLRLQESGLCVHSDTTLRGRYCLRVAFCNHRTRPSDIDELAAAVLLLGNELLQASRSIP
ncbi:aminotransferase class V-fold PLP-dependent enzyme [Roseibacterium sp. SDUM158016]|uniref:pyridoxal phosphate-dependent decarboxylase family protein n=1 Tax=Roseicyclus sediminis TaxID=2980997 RepID=UPI0021D34321|nr:pyridoxal-dependent decarboxylase [Roseibacterium sp. SDUM158016]MCU4652992.1 aminotransferase class V-fold PLP-dependent enzyme [Roseibacterium sp. SDUM158016]